MTRPTVAALDDAREATRALLLPVDVRRWLRLAVLAFLVGGGGGVPALQGNVDTPVPPGGPGPSPEFPLPSPVPVVHAPSSLVAIAAVLVVALLVLGLVYAVAGAVAEFALVVAVRDREVGLRAAARTHLPRGLRLFGFRLAVWLAALALVGLPALLVVAGVVGLSPAFVLLAVPLVLLGLVVLVVVWLTLRLTTDFAVPTMLVADATVLDAWRRLLPTLRAAPVETGLYLLVRVALGVAAGVVTGLVAGLAALVVAVPFVAVGLGGYVLFGPSLGTAGLVALGLLAVVYAVVAVALWTLVRTPVVVYLRAFSLATLGRLDPALDVLGVSGSEEPGTDGRRGTRGGAADAGDDASRSDTGGDDATDGAVE